ncbi:kanadaptin-like [Amphibalanus amphitrite]|uniref:kanadaptin-like n=1 Tax=Amphibalanus amphitrite TaxID=1232801 RepID=UPI001C90166A|nr:kanadaptin-like [Amphibalanus amphitrite]
MADDPDVSKKNVSSDGFVIPGAVPIRPRPAGSANKQPRSPDLPPPPPPGGSSEKTEPSKQGGSGDKAGLAGGRSAPPAGSGVPYRPPRWAGCPPRPYSLEVLRGGQILDTVPLEERACVVFGRLPECDVRLEHPSISRYHAALVYRASTDDEHEAGYYLYDLGSTHGSTLNKNPIRPNVYCRMRVGHMCKFGGSTRLFILQGPEEDREPESDLTVTELREIGQRRQEQQQERLERLETEEGRTEGTEANRGQREQPTAADTTAEEGISWGMAEDADEESDLQFNPFALGEAENEQLYLVDPKRTLRGWFEREGHELEYQTEELPGGRHICRITLPLDTADGKPPVAEAQHVGKKKEAVFQCALEACRLLDRAGVLRQAKQESRQTRRRKQTGYDSDDDDTFLDRTGAVERKRQRRQQTTAAEQPAETYQSLLAQYQKVEAEAAALERRLQQAETAAQSPAEPAAADGDELDAFMTRLSRGAIGDRQERRQLRARLSQLRSEQARLGRLVNLTRPAELPPLQLPPQAVSARSPLTGFIGRRRGKGPATPAAGRRAAPGAPLTGGRGPVRAPAGPPSVKDSPAVSATPADRDAGAGQECDPAGAAPTGDCPRLLEVRTAGSEGDRDSKVETGRTSPPPAGTDDSHSAGRVSPSPAGADDGPAVGCAPPPPAGANGRPSIGPTLPPPAGANGSPSPRPSPPEEPTKPVRPPKKRRQDRKAAAPQYSELAGDGSYDVWMPPEGQTGDGRTSLNDKLGY